jgi:hypothetical protein
MSKNQQRPFESVVLRADVLQSVLHDPALSAEEKTDFKLLVAGVFGEREQLPVSAAARLLRGTVLLREGLLRAISAS